MGCCFVLNVIVGKILSNQFGREHYLQIELMQVFVELQVGVHLVTIESLKHL
jgi:hypothetical protein